MQISYVVAQYVLLFVTTYVSVFSVYDIYDDCVRRYVNDSQTKSDAVVCAQLCPICPARGWGVVWLVVSMGFWAGGVCYISCCMLEVTLIYEGLASTAAGR